MEDQKIIDLYTNREERAIHETDKKYGRLCTSISMGILNDMRDSEECVSDTWLTLWNKIPPKKPNPFKAYICRIIKNLSLKRYEYHHAKKRNSQYDLSLEELEECISKGQNVESQIELRELKWIIAKFIDELPKEKRILFLRRYWFLQSVTEMARDYKTTPKNMSVKLLRIRKELKETKDAEASITKAVNTCINNGILRDFLIAHKAEVIGMFLTEYNEEEAKKCLREESYEEGFAEGIEKGIKEGFTEGRLEGLAKGEKNIKDILAWLNKQNRSDDIIKAISDDSYMEKLKKEYEESQK